MIINTFHPRTIFARTTAGLLVSIVLFSSSGCSISDSLESSVDIIASPFESSSDSSGGNTTQAYQQETESYTSAFVNAGGGTMESFQHGLSDIAARQGISDWGAIPQTWTSVGRGLASAGVDEQTVTAYARTWSGDDDRIAVLVMQGYSQTP